MAVKRGIQEIEGALPPRKRRVSGKAAQNEEPTTFFPHPLDAARGQIQQHSQVTLSGDNVEKWLLQEEIYRETLEEGTEDGAESLLKQQSPKEAAQTTSIREGNQPTILPLSTESLRLLDQSDRPRHSLSMSSEGTESKADTDASDASVNAYNENFELYLRHRSIYMIKNHNHHPSKDLEDVRDAVFKTNEVAEPSKDQARIVRDISRKVTGEPDVVLSLLPEFVPLKAIRTDPQKQVVTDKVWHHYLSVEPEMKPRLRIPKPDVTIGWDLEVFPFRKAERSLRAFQFPVASSNELSWPLFTIEAKGEGGCLRVAQLQNLYNASIMLSNLRELAKAAHREDEFFNKIHAMTLEITTETVQLSYYWATRSDSGEVSYYGDVLESWTLRSRRYTQFIEAHQCIHNAIELITEKSFKLVYECMETVEKIYDTANMTNIPTPLTLSKTSGVRKTRGKRTLTRNTPTSSASESWASTSNSKGSGPKETSTERGESREKHTVVTESPNSRSSVVSLATYVIQSINPFHRRQAV